MATTTTVLQEAFKKLEPVLPDYNDGVERITALKERRARITALKERRASLFPVESEAIRVIDTHIRVAERGYSPLIAEGFRVLSLEVLTWRREDGFPKLALFSLNNAERSFLHAYSNTLETTPALPPILKRQYADLTKRVTRGSKITTTFSGILPDQIRDLITKETAKTKTKIAGVRFKELFILAEASAWKVSFQPAPKPVVRRDPFLLGWDGNDLWHLASFDLTPVEEYLKQEFVVKP